MIDEKKLIESLRASLNTGRESFHVDLIVECIEEQPKIGEWIPCSECLPEDVDNRFFMCIVENHEEDLPMFCQYEEEYGLSSNIFREKYIIPALLKKYNVDNVWKSKEIQNKCYQSNIKNHNGLYHTQTSEWQSKYNHGCNRKYIYNNIIFKSYYEVMFAKELDKYDISYQYETESFIYYDKFNKKHTYTPDFLVNGKIYEIKGDIFLDKDNHLINFYDRKLDYIQEAKEICMNKNKVIIIKTSELFNMIKNNTLLNFLEINN